MRVGTYWQGGFIPRAIKTVGEPLRIGLTEQEAEDYAREHPGSEVLVKKVDEFELFDVYKINRNFKDESQLKQVDGWNHDKDILRIVWTSSNNYAKQCWYDGCNIYSL